MTSEESHKRTASTVGLKGSRPSSPLPAGGDSDSITPSNVDGSLDALLSPQLETRDDAGSMKVLRDSVVDGDVVDVDLGGDDSHFSNVPLSAGTIERNRNEATRIGSGVSLLNRPSSSSHTGRPVSYAIGQSASTPQVPATTRASHKKSASTTTLESDGHNSSGNLPFLLHRLDLQKVKEDADPTSRRLSLDGQHRIHEEFSRLQSNKTEALNVGAGESIDWGMYVQATYVLWLTTHHYRLLGTGYGRRVSSCVDLC